MLNLSSLFTVYCSDRAVSHIYFSLCQQWNYPDSQVRMVVPNCAPSCRIPNLVEAVPRYLKWLCYRSPDWPRDLTEKRFLRDLKDFDAIYLWPNTSIETFRKVKQQSKPIFLERINCYTKQAKFILDDASSRLGIAPQHKITADMIQQEEEEISLADFIFCPSPEVKKSFMGAGVPEHKLLLTSYGWSPKRFPHFLSNKPLSDTITVIFVGDVSVRKGAHLLLQAWEKAGIKGRLLLCGRMEPAIAETCSSLLARSDVIHRDYTSDIAFAYREADFFAFPSLEEGSPLVTYEAMANGLPVLTSPMGAGGVARDGKDGIIVSPYDEEALVTGLQQLAGCAELRLRMSDSARERAQEFTWEKVARRRAELVLARLKPA
ncbi:glycosyltransferase family 4 protein [Microcoleus vaginatus]|uniref:glycosyltransferase family 4 protein n=1 Tax=Microcoleus vaginatus TaxID=119532 RepID=UPI00168A0ED8|nr:glycosyltransferase family 4 protein [Microcoleus sp. FACHB-84]MBD2011426.1 glycosyltransferase family 4 protein [Microcoleus sp. FACHB-45]